MIDKQTNDQYEDNLFLWRRYSRLGEELGAIINEQQDIILGLNCLDKYNYVHGFITITAKGKTYKVYATHNIIVTGKRN